MDASKEQSVQAAIGDIKKGVGLNIAAKAYGVPRTTLQSRMKQADPHKSVKGPNPVLQDHEDVLVEWIEECAKKGFPRRKENVLDSVQEIVEELGIENPFLNGRPGDRWYANFLKRHPEISVRTPESVSAASSCVSEKDIRGWFEHVQKLLKEENLSDILKKPRQIFNGDETNFVFSPEGKVVLATRGAKNVYEVDSGEAKKTLSCMFTFSASGEMVPPMMIYPYKRIPKDIVKSVPKEWGIGRSESGWMTSEVFYEYIGNVFNDFLEKNRIPRPVILFVDGHKSHLTIQTSKMCKELQIILVCLYPNATQILQPADVSAFRPLKMEWTNAVREWRRDHLHESLTKDQVAPILASILQNRDMTQILKNGFKATGLYPWNANAIDFSKCIGSNVAELLNKQKKTVHHSGESNVLTRQKFTETVGRERILIFKEMLKQNLSDDDSTNDEANSTQILFRLWRELGEPDFVEATGQTNSVQISDQSASVEVPEPSTSRTTNENPAAAAILQWPKSPKRKEKRQTERVPFVLTSQKWQNMNQDKVDKKKAEEEAKEERKKTRAAKKKAQEDEKEKRKQMQEAKKKRKAVKK